MDELQREIDAKAVAPRVTPADIDANIVSEHYFTARDGRRGAIQDGTYEGREQSMKKYIGTKIVAATPMNRGQYNSYRGWELPSDEKWDDEGYLVEYMDGGKPNHQDHNGYISWSPKEQFDNAYREIDGMTFGQAIEAMKQGRKVARTGWNGKGLSVELQVPDENSKMTLPYIFMNYPATPASATAPANHINARVPWLASQTDMLAEDWTITE